jgi:uncharacterized protein (DUF2141 family)
MLTPPATLDVAIDGARNAKGMLHFWPERRSAFFPDCSRDAAAVKKSIPGTSKTVRLGNIKPGRYALTVFHDENSDHKLDKTLGIPREGFGFLAQPAGALRPTGIPQVDIELKSGLTRHTVRLQYVL